MVECGTLCHSIEENENSEFNSPSSEEMAFYKFFKSSGFTYKGKTIEENNDIIE